MKGINMSHHGRTGMSSEFGGRITGIVVIFSLWATVTACGQHNTDLKSGFVTTSDGVQIHYVESGSGPSMVLVPGWTMPAEIWEEQIRAFSASHRVVAVDPRSQGRSEKVSEGHYPERRARDIHELVQELELAPAVLVGWSLAVPELLTYVDQFGTDTVRTLVLVHGFIGADQDPCAPNPLRGMLRAMHVDRAAHAAGFVRGMFRSEHPEEYLDQLTDASLATPTTPAFALLAHLMVSDSDWRPVLEKVDRPLLYVVTPSLADQASMVQARLPDARTEIFEEAGHALFVDEPDRFNQLVAEFLKQHTINH